MVAPQLQGQVQWNLNDRYRYSGGSAAGAGTLATDRLSPEWTQPSESLNLCFLQETCLTRSEVDNATSVSNAVFYGDLHRDVFCEISIVVYCNIVPLLSLGGTVVLSMHSLGGAVVYAVFCEVSIVVLRCTVTGKSDDLSVISMCCNPGCHAYKRISQKVALELEMLLFFRTWYHPQLTNGKITFSPNKTLCHGLQTFESEVSKCRNIHHQTCCVLLCCQPTFSVLPSVFSVLRTSNYSCLSRRHYDFQYL